MYRTLYADSYWDYQNPFKIETDPFEALVSSRVSQFKARKSRPKPPPRDFNVSPRVQAQLANESNQNQKQKPKQKQKQNDGVAAARLQMKKSNGQTFVSSDTKPLRKQPRVVVHLPTPSGTMITLDAPSQFFFFACSMPVSRMPELANHFQTSACQQLWGLVPHCASNGPFAVWRHDLMIQ
jgi:hypothetical protein